MSKIVREVRHFVIHPEAIDLTHEELAEEALRLAKGGHIVQLQMPGGAVSVAPDEDHAEVVARMKEAMPPHTGAQPDEHHGKAKPKSKPE
jgi:hypothetical protein